MSQAPKDPKSIYTTPGKGEKVIPTNVTKTLNSSFEKFLSFENKILVFTTEIVFPTDDFTWTLVIKSALASHYRLMQNNEDTILLNIFKRIPS